MSSFKHLVDSVMKHGDTVIGEKSPPGFKGTVKGMKDEGDIDNPYALAWWMKNKGYKSHKKSSGANKNESIRVWHPTHGQGVVKEISESYINISWDNLQNRMTAPTVLPFSDAKYLTFVHEEYSNNPSDVDYDDDKDAGEKKRKHKKRKRMKESKKKLDEGMVAIGMAGIGGTHRSSIADDLDLGHLTLADLMLEEEDNEDSDDRDSKPDWDRGKRSHDSSDKSELRKSSDKGSDYVNVPRPADSVLTNQEDQPKYHPEPLSTMAGYDEAHDEMEPDGDYGEDLLPVDAPEVPKVRDMEDSGTRHNTRKSGEGEDTNEADDKNIDLEGDKPEDEDNQMKKYESKNFDLDASDLGLTEMEHGESMSGYGEGEGEGYMDMREHEMGAGEIAFTKEFLGKLCSALSSQSPDDDKCKALCDGLAAAQQEKGDMALDVADWDNVKAKAAEAYSNGYDGMEGKDYAEEGMKGDDYDYDEEGMKGDDYDYDEEGMKGDDYDNYDDYDYDYDEDRAEGDGEKAGSEGGKEHEGKIKMMDRKSGSRYHDKGREDPNRGKETRMRQRRDKRRDKQAGKYAMEDGSGTPVGSGSTSGPGGGSTKDLSKPKNYKGTAVGTQTGSGPGGGSTSNDGQKPTKDGGSNLVPANDKGNQLGAAENPFSKGKPNPRNQKALAAEARKRKSSKKKLDEAIMLGMSSIPHIGGGGRDAKIPDDAFDDDDELKMIKRRAGMDNWWK